MRTRKSEKNRKGDIDMSETENKNGNFAANLLYLRQIEGMSQEALAEKLNVSRQSVSKWESASAYPEMQTLILLCDLFKIDMDTLLRGNVVRESNEDRNGYNDFMDRQTKGVSIGVGSILFGVGVLAGWEGLYKSFSLPQEMEAIGPAVFMVFLLIGVVLFIVMGIQEDRFREKYPVIEPFYTQEQKESFFKKFTWQISGSVVAILIDVILLILLGDWMEKIGKDDYLMMIFMWIMCGAVSTLVWAGMQEDKFDIPKYNMTNLPEFKKKEELAGIMCAIIMMIATAVFITLSAKTGDWGNNWWIFAVGGILCGVTCIVINFIVTQKIKSKVKEESEKE